MMLSSAKESRSQHKEQESAWPRQERKQNNQFAKGHHIQCEDKSKQ